MKDDFVGKLYSYYSSTPLTKREILKDYEKGRFMSNWDFTGGNTISPYDWVKNIQGEMYRYYSTGTGNEEEVMKHEFNLAGTKKEDIAIKWFKSNGMFRVYVKEEMFAYRTLNNGDTIDHVTYDEGLLTVHLKKEDPILVKVE